MDRSYINAAYDNRRLAGQYCGGLVIREVQTQLHKDEQGSKDKQGSEDQQRGGKQVWRRQMKLRISKGARKQGWKRQINWINPISLMRSGMNLVSLMDQIVCFYQLYTENEKETHSIRNYVHKIESIIIYMSEI